MKFFLKILNETRSRNHMKVDGYSGARFIFQWDPKMRAYKYQPKDQNEVDDLFRTMGRSTAYIFAPVELPDATPTSKALFTLEEAKALLAERGDMPETTTASTEVPELDEKLVEQCLHRGVIVTDEDSDETAKRLISAYDKGAADSLNSLPAVKKRGPRKPKAPKPN